MLCEKPMHWTAPSPQGHQNQFQEKPRLARPPAAGLDTRSATEEGSPLRRMSALILPSRRVLSARTATLKGTKKDKGLGAGQPRKNAKWGPPEFKTGQSSTMYTLQATPAYGG